MQKVKLQVALDFLELPRAMAVAEEVVAAGADILEAGTPLIKSEGLDAVRALRDRFPNITIVADTKTMDAGKIEAQAASSAGADIMTVLAAASDSTIRECVEAGNHYGIQIAVDLIGIEDPVAFASRAADLGCHFLDVHCAIDNQMRGDKPLALLSAVRAATDLTLAVAGGLTGATVPDAVSEGADIIIIGGAITKAVDVSRATAEICQAIDTGQASTNQYFHRATAETIRDILSTVRSSNVSDAFHRASCLRDIRPVGQGQFACGQAVTVRTFPGDWAKPVEAIDVAQTGEIIVIDAAGVPPAVWGELATESAKNKGLGGLVVNGAVRDTRDIREMQFPVWTKHITSHAGDPHGTGEINIPLHIDGQRIMPGDWIIADDDGVMVIPQQHAVELANRAADVLEAENRIRAEITTNKSTLAQVVNLSRWEKKGASGVIRKQ